MVGVFLIETANKGQHLRVGLVHFVICYKSVDVSHLLRNSHAGRWLGFATTKQEMESGYLAKLWMCVQAKHKPFSQNLSTPHLTPFVWLKCTGVILCRLFLLANAKMVLKAVFSTVSVHICLYVSHVWGAAGALKSMRHTHPDRQHVWAQGLARMTWAWFPQDELQWGLQQPERQRNDKNILCPPPRTCSPSALSLSTLRRLFSGRPGFLCDGVVEERRKRGMGQRGKDRHRERWIAMGWWSCARSDLGEFIASSCEGVWE